MSTLLENEAILFEPTMPALLQEPIEEEEDLVTYSGHSSQRQSTDSESIKTNASSSFPLVTPPELEEDVSNPLLSHIIEIVDLENEAITSMTEPLDKKTSFVKKLQRKPSKILSSASSKTRAADLTKQKLTPLLSEATVLQQSKSSNQTKRSSSTTNQQMDTFVAFLRSSAATTYKKVTASSTDLVRSRSKRTWSIQLKPSTSSSSTCSTSSIPHNNQKRSSISPAKKTQNALYPLDPNIFLSSPDEPKQHKRVLIEKNLSFVHVLHETMIHGGYLSPSLYVPMELW
ncbi:hypothetical protein BD560DRAFT_390325 [Blakeslea trispora]|nr:hypothetical protein BD560DRAFT_390325 [Blakeslea trispora]